MSEMIERVAQAIDPLPWTDLARDHWRKGGVEEGKEAARAKARAAIEAMREPTEAMVKAGTIGWDPMDGSGVRPVFDPTKPYEAMIDAALNDKSPPPG